MLAKFKTHKHIKYFFLYSVSFLVYGACISGLGPFIPYLSASTGIVETEYSYLFSCRSFGMLAGALLCKLLQKCQLTNHTIMIIGTLGICGFSYLFTYTIDSVWLGVWFFLVGAGYSLLEIMLNVCILLINNPEEIQFWMLITHGMFGVGGLFGSMIVYLSETKVFLILGLMIGASSFFCFLLKTPQSFQTQTNEAQQSTTEEICLCLLLFLYIGNECTYGGWISTFVIMNHVTSTKGATVFPTIFWGTMTLSRFLMAFVPGSSSQKLIALIFASFCSGVVTLLVIYVRYITYACYLSALLFGISMSSVYPLIFAFPLEQGFVLEDSQTTNIVMVGLVSEGLLTMVVGAFMNSIHVNVFFYYLSLAALGMGGLYRYYMHLIEDEKESIQEELNYVQWLDENKHGL